MIRKCLFLLLLFALVSSLSGFAFAGDSSPGTYNWTGPYVGLNAGWARAEAKSTTTTAFYPTTMGGDAYLPISEQPAFDAAANPILRSNNFIGGIQGGYNRQFGNFVIGGEMDFNYMNIKNGEISTTRYTSYLYSTSATFRSSIDTDWLVTVRPRVGYALQNLFFYGTGGLALTEIKARWSYSHPYPILNDEFREYASKSKLKVGWTLGGGVEVGLSKNWSVKGEYLYADFGKVSGSGIISLPDWSLPQSLYHKTRLKTQIIRAGLNYRF